MMLSTTKTLPPGFKLVEDILELKQLINEKLKPNKRLYDNSNLEAIPQDLYMHSPSCGVYYPKYYWKAIPDEKVNDLIGRKLLYRKE